MNNKITISLEEERAYRMNSGQAMMIATIFFLTISLTIIFGLIGPIVRQQKLVVQQLTSRQSYFLAEAGVEDVVYRLKTGQSVDTSETLTLAGSSVTTVTSDISGGKMVVSTGNTNNNIRKIRTDLMLGVGVAFHYGVQVGEGGLVMGNSTINGNVFSNGSIKGANGATITGSAFSAGSSGLIDKVVVGENGLGDAWAYTVKNSTIAGNLYCQIGQNNNKSCNTSRSNPEASELPITDEQIDLWKDEAILGGTIGTYDPSQDVSLGPTKINGDLILDDNSLKFTITGVIYVTGNVVLSNNQGSIGCASSFDSNSCVIIADGHIHSSNNITFNGSGHSDSYVLLLSTLDCDGTVAVSPTSGKSCGHHNGAIDLHNNSTGSVVYAPHGLLNLHQNVKITEAAAYKINLENNASVTYEQGLVNVNFQSGPGGGYEIKSWQEIE